MSKPPIDRIDRYSGRKLQDDVEDEPGLSVSERVGKFEVAKVELQHFHQSGERYDEAVMGTRRERRYAEQTLHASADHAATSVSKAELSKAVADREISREAYQEVASHQERLKEAEQRRERGKDQEKDPFE